MAYQFQTHYTLDEARELLPEVRQWLERLGQLRSRLQEEDQRLASLQKGGNDLGGALVNRWLATLADIKDVFHKFQCRDIQVKDVQRGLIDFPSLRNGKEIFLCWEKDEEDIEFWHDLDSGYAGRERV